MIKGFESFFRVLFKSAQNSSLMSILGQHQGIIQDCFAGRSTERCGPQVAHPCCIVSTWDYYINCNCEFQLASINCSIYIRWIKRNKI